MNKYMRAKKFRQQRPKHYRADNYYQDKEARSKKEFRQYCIIILILLLCTIFYTICIHWNIFGIKDWYQRNEPISTRETKSIPATTPVEEPAAYIEHVVSFGETIWGIAEKYHPNEDTRKVSWAIRAFNGKDGKRMSAKIIPGQVVKVPMGVDAVEELEMDETQLEEREQGVPGLASRQGSKWLTMEATAYCSCVK